MTRKQLLGTAGTLLVLNYIAWAYFKFRHFGNLGAGDLWQAQVSLWQGMLLFDTLVFVLLYTDAAWHQWEMTRVERSDRNKPLVVTVGDDSQLRIGNIGPGAAVNVYVVVPDPMDPDVHLIGALGAGQEARPPGSYFMVNQVPSNHLVIAEALYTRTQQWQVSLNVVREGKVVVRFAEFQTRGRTSFQQFLDAHWLTLSRQLREFSREVQGKEVNAGPRKKTKRQWWRVILGQGVRAEKPDAGARPAGRS